MFFRLHAVLPSRERPRNFVFRVNRETARFDPTTRPFTFTQSRGIRVYIYIYDRLLRRGRIYSQDPRLQDRVSTRKRYCESAAMLDSRPR